MRGSSCHKFYVNLFWVETWDVLGRRLWLPGLIGKKRDRHISKWVDLISSFLYCLCVNNSQIPFNNLPTLVLPATSTLLILTQGHPSHSSGLVWRGDAYSRISSGGVPHLWLADNKIADEWTHIFQCQMLNRLVECFILPMIYGFRRMSVTLGPENRKRSQTYRQRLVP